jgi:hypothetical protein
MRPCLILICVLAALGMDAWAGKLQSVELKDGTTVFGRVVEISEESIHVVSTRINRKIPLDQLSAETRKQFETSALVSSGQADKTRDKLLSSEWSHAGYSGYVARPRLVVYPYYTNYYRSYQPYFCSPRFIRYRLPRSTLSVHIDF